jgi:hypothetical protein
MRFVVRYGEDFLRGPAEGALVEVNLETFCREEIVSICLNSSKIYFMKAKGFWVVASPSTRFTTTSFQNLFDFADPPSLRSWPLFSSSACFLRLAIRDSTYSALGRGAVGGGPVAVRFPITVAGFDGVVCMKLRKAIADGRDLEQLLIAAEPLDRGN